MDLCLFLLSVLAGFVLPALFANYALRGRYADSAYYRRQHQRILRQARVVYADTDQWRDLPEEPFDPASICTDYTYAPCHFDGEGKIRGAL